MISPMDPSFWSVNPFLPEQTAFLDEYSPDSHLDPITAAAQMLAIAADAMLVVLSGADELELRQSEAEQIAVSYIRDVLPILRDGNIGADLLEVLTSARTTIQLESAAIRLRELAYALLG
jgi:hypothetical protein